MKQGEYSYDLAKELFPICRSITGNGVRQTLKILQREVPELTINEVPSGTKVFDWTVPKEWNIKNAWVKDKYGKLIIDFAETNLHIMGYSIPVHKKVVLNELMSIIYTEPEQPDVIPYVTSYYKERYGFCISENQKNRMLLDYDENDEFEIYIDSTLENGSLTYGEFVIPSINNDKHEDKDEVLISTYICHPSMANNELSGPCVSIAIAKWLKSLPCRKYNYRFIFIPETIGSIAYLSLHLDYLKKHLLFGLNITCVGDDRTYSFVNTRYSNTLADKVLENILKFHYPNFKKYSFLKRGSDERQYNAPGVDLPVCTFSRSLFQNYPEYHTSADNLDLISPVGLQGSFDVVSKVIMALEWNEKYIVKCICEPQLGKRGLYPTVSKKGSYDEVQSLIDFIAYADGKNDLFDISNIINVPVDELIEIVTKLKEADLITIRE